MKNFYHIILKSILVLDRFLKVRYFFYVDYYVPSKTIGKVHYNDLSLIFYLKHVVYSLKYVVCLKMGNNGKKCAIVKYERRKGLCIRHIILRIKYKRKEKNYEFAKVTYTEDQAIQNEINNLLSSQ